MKAAQRTLLVLLLGWAAGGAAHAQGLLRLALVFEGEHRLAVEEGHVFVAGGSTTLPADGRVAGSVVVIDGVLALDGTVAGDVVQLGGALAIGPEARLEGRFVTAGGERSVAAGADLVGGTVRDLALVADLARAPPTAGGRLARLAFQVALLALVAFLWARWAPGPLERAAEALAHHPVVAVAMGALSALVGSVLLVAMAFTVVLIPVALFGGVASALAIGFGWLAWGVLIGRGLARRGWLPRAIPQAAAAAMGTAAFVVFQAGVAAVPWLGGTVALLATVAAFGAALLTGFGVRRFVPDGSSPSSVAVDPTAR